MRENTTRMSSTPTKQMSPTPSAITTNLAKVQPNNTLVVYLFQSNVIESEYLAMQIDATMNVKEEGEQRHLLQKTLPIIAQDIQAFAFICTTDCKLVHGNKLVEFCVVKNMLLEENDDLLEKVGYLEKTESKMRICDVQ